MEGEMKQFSLEGSSIHPNRAVTCQQLFTISNIFEQNAGKLNKIERRNISKKQHKGNSNK